MTQNRVSQGSGFRVCSAVIFLSSMLMSQSSWAAEKRPATQPGLQSAPADQPSLQPGVSEADEAGTLPEKIDVQAMKRRYWTVGNEDEMDVVQNRLYKKKGRIELAGRYGFWSDDPFIDSSSIGFSLGYHIDEFVSVHGYYGAVSWGKSAAYDTAVRANFTPVTNPGKSIMGAEARGSLIYGKLSLLGKSIIYYDFNFALGLAKISNDAGDSPIALSGGFGQQVYINKSFFLTIDYRMLKHSDKFGASQANLNSSRSVTTSWIQLGVGTFFL